MFVATAAEMRALGEHLARACPTTMVIYLSGDLGTGKTTLVRGFLRGCGYVGAVKSPTYTLVEPYELADQTIYHFDLYRLTDPEELEYLGVRDYFTAPAICLVEWAERAQGFMHPPDLIIELAYSNDGREVNFTIFSEAGKSLIQQIKADVTL